MKKLLLMRNRLPAPATAACVVAAILCLGLTATATDSASDARPTVVLGELRHEPVSKVGRRNRTDFAGGEDIRCWIDSFGDGVSRADISGEIVWSSTGSSVYPLLGSSTIVSVAISDKESTMLIRPTYRPLVISAILSKQRPVFELIVPQGPIEERTYWEQLTVADAPKQLYELMGTVDGHETDIAEVQNQAAGLLKSSLSPAVRALVYFELAHAYAQSCLQFPDRVIENSYQALQLPLDPSRRLRLHVYCGDALRVLTSNQSFSKRRRRAATIYLQGLKEVDAYDLPDTPLEMPPIPPFSTLARRDKEHARKLKEFEDERKRVRHIREMINHHHVLTQQIVSVYQRKPFNRSELEDLASFILQDPAAAKRLAESVPSAQQ